MKSTLGFFDRLQLSKKIRKINKMDGTKYAIHEQRALLLHWVCKRIGFKQNDANDELYHGMQGDVQSSYSSCYDILSDVGVILGNSIV